MLELAPDLLAELRAGRSVAVVSIIGVLRSAPRGVGASMAVATDGSVIGSISGGCVEGDAVVLASAVLSDGVGRAARFGFTDEAAHAAGLACGGTIDVVAYRVSPVDAPAVSALERAARDTPVHIGVVTAGADVGRVIPVPNGGPDLLDVDRMPVSEYGAESLLILSHSPRPRLIIVGAGDHAAALCRVASAAGFAVTVCDPWELLVTRERFPEADRLVIGLPHEHLAHAGPDEVDARTAVCVLTHDERIDVPALRVALGLPIGFVGAMGSRATAARRAMLLRECGVGDDALHRLHSPLGLDLQGSTPDETAVAVLAEIVAARRHGTGLPLRDLHGPVHAPSTAGRAAAHNCSDEPALGADAERTAATGARR